MKVGRIKDSILKRTVLKGIEKRNSEIISGGNSYDFASVLSTDGDMVLATDSMTGDGESLPVLVIHAAVNKLYAKGAKPKGVMLNITLPEKKREIALKRLMERVEKTCEEIGISIAGGHTLVSDAVSSTVFSATAFGCLEKMPESCRGGLTGYQLVMTKWTAIEGTVIATEQKRDELSDRFNADFLSEAEGLSAYLSLKKEAEVLCSYPESIVRPVRTGGVFAALWDMGEMTDAGVRAYLKDIPIRQESIEIFNYFDLNPYTMISGGSMLIATKEASSLCESLWEAGVEAVVIGELTEGNDRIVLNAGRGEFLQINAGDMAEINDGIKENADENNENNEIEIRYLEPYKTDEIIKL